jgi:glutamate-ammonia-ligase adenylyltransferase
VFAVVALGRLGGAELSYASDLDVVFVFEGDGAADRAEAERLATALLRFVDGGTPAARIYELDPDLRPEGKQGSLARSLHGFTQYHERWAKTWERQAMTRARPVAGDLALGDRLLAQIQPFVWGPLRPDDEREIRRMKARVERERIPADQDPDYHLKLGRGSLADVEWTAQLLQLRHGLPAAGTMAALQRLEEAGHLNAEDATTLTEAYRFCEITRNRLYLVSGGDADALPRRPEQLTRLARSLGTTAGQLRDDHHRVTRRARQVVERVFYDKA